MIAPRCAQSRHKASAHCRPRCSGSCNRLANCRSSSDRISAEELLPPFRPLGQQNAGAIHSKHACSLNRVRKIEPCARRRSTSATNATQFRGKPVIFLFQFLHGVHHLRIVGDAGSRLAAFSLVWRSMQVCLAAMLLIASHSSVAANGDGAAISRFSAASFWLGKRRVLAPRHYSAARIALHGCSM
jgi:hypothetical protein